MRRRGRHRRFARARAAADGALGPSARAPSSRSRAPTQGEGDEGQDPAGDPGRFVSTANSARAAGAFLSFLGVWSVLEILTTLTNSKRRALHDLLVRRTRNASQISALRYLGFALPELHGKLQSLMTLTIEIEQEADGRWLAEVPELPGVMVDGDTEGKAAQLARALAFRVLADKIEAGELEALSLTTVSFAA